MNPTVANRQDAAESSLSAIRGEIAALQDASRGRDQALATTVTSLGTGLTDFESRLSERLELVPTVSRTAEDRNAVIARVDAQIGVLQKALEREAGSLETRRAEADIAQVKRIETLEAAIADMGKVLASLEEGLSKRVEAAEIRLAERVDAMDDTVKREMKSLPLQPNSRHSATQSPNSMSSLRRLRLRLNRLRVLPIRMLVEPTMTRERTNRRPRQRDSDHELGERDAQWVCIMSIVGLDFGTTKCLGAIWKNEKPLIVGTGIDDSRIPSLVLVLPDGTTLVGSEAQHYRGRYGGGCLSIPGCKRRMETREGLAWASWHAQRHEVAAMVLQYAKGRVENRAGSPISTAVLTVPGCATLSYREALVKAATIAGIKVDRLLGEAVAAALPFIFSPRCPAECTLASVTFGGGTLDIAFMGVDKSIGVVEVLGVAGDPKLGGQDFDDIIVDHIVACNPSARAGQDRLSNAQYEILREVASQIKTDLSFASSATIRLTGLFTAQSSSTRLQDPELTRDAFQKMSQGLLARVERATEKALVDVEWKGGRWHGERLVLLNGGSSRMPAFQDLIRKAFYPCTRIFSGSETSAVDGALMYARILGGENKSFIVMDVLPHPMHLGRPG